MSIGSNYGMFNLERTTFRPHGPTMTILDPKIAKFCFIWPEAALATPIWLNTG